jgi:hypothetical protein
MRNSMLCNAMLALAVALPAAGCLVGDRSHTLYLDPDGAFTWEALERHIRSDAAAAADRDREEADFLAQSLASEQPIARGLRKLDPVSFRSEVVRDRRPFAVVSEARYDSIQNAFQRLLDGLGLPGRAEITREGGLVQLTVTIEPPQLDSEGAETDDDLVALIGDLENMRIVLTRGKFVEAVGFKLTEDGAVATPLDQDVQEKVPAPLVYRLAWTE